MNEIDTQDLIQKVLQPYREALASDGYELVVDDPGRAGGTAVRVVATDSACADCLVPKSLMASMLENGLTNAGLSGVLPVRVTYPNDPAS